MFSAYSEYRIRRYCVCGFRLNHMHDVSEIGKDFAAPESDIETDLYYYRARYYDPAAGRFLSEDPVEFQGGINFYATQ